MKLRNTLKYKFWIQEKANPPDNADAYRVGLTNYCAKSSYFKEKLPYERAAYTHLRLNYYIAIFSKGQSSVSQQKNIDFFYVTS